MTPGARRDLRLALRSTRATRTHLAMLRTSPTLSPVLRTMVACALSVINRLERELLGHLVRESADERRAA